MNEPRRSGEFHHADPAYRKQMLGWLMALVIVGAIGLLALQYWLSHLAATLGVSDPYQMQRWLQRVLAGICLMLAAGGGGFAVWIYRVARQTKIERRWPPIHMRTTQDVRIRYLTSADALVTQLMAVAFGLSAFSVIVAAWAAWLIWRT